MDNLFSTHPNTENRIAALQEQAQGMGEMQGPSGGSAFELPPMEGRDEPASLGRGGAGRKRARAGRGPWG